MSRIHSFPPQCGDRPKVLVLGSIPGVASLQAVQYYAHPRNTFWPIMAGFFGFDAAAPYGERLAALKHHRVALWDVLQSCVRPGSLDSAIDRDSIAPNAIDRWLTEQPQVEMILLNGGRAATEFKRHFRHLSNDDSLPTLTMPSTSPAYAAMPGSEKQRHWHSALSRVFPASG